MPAQAECQMLKVFDCFIGRNPRDCEEACRVLARSRHEFYRSRAADNTSSVRLLAVLARDPSVLVRTAVAKRVRARAVGMQSRIRAALLDDPATVVRETIADGAMDRPAYLTLARDASSHVRAAVAAATDSQLVLSLLSRDPDECVRVRVARRSRRVSVLRRLFADPSGHVVYAAHSTLQWLGAE